MAACSVPLGASMLGRCDGVTSDFDARMPGYLDDERFLGSLTSKANRGSPWSSATVSQGGMKLCVKGPSGLYHALVGPAVRTHHHAGGITRLQA